MTTAITPNIIGQTGPEIPHNPASPTVPNIAVEDAVKPAIEPANNPTIVSFKPALIIPFNFFLALNFNVATPLQLHCSPVIV